MAAAATVSIIMLLIAGLVLAGFIVGIVLWVTGGKSRGGEMACGGCGYSVRGLEQLNCPECGADLRAVGISGGASGGKRLTGILLTSICGFILLSCCGLSAFSWMATGVSHQSSPNPTVPIPNTTVKPAPPASGEADTPEDVNTPGDETLDPPPTDETE